MFKNPFKKKVIKVIPANELTSVPALRVRVLNESDSSLGEDLGIDEKRFTELQEFMKKVMDKHTRISEVMEIVSKECKHANELAACMYALGYLSGLSDGLPKIAFTVNPNK